MIRALAIAAATLAFAALASAQVFYKSVGPDGKVTYSDRPPAEGTIAKTLKLEDLPNSALPTKTLAELEQLEKSGAKGGFVPTAGVTLFAASWCGYCRQARAYLSRKSIRYQEVDVDTPIGKQAFVRAGGVGGIPLLLANGQKLRGFSAEAYDAVFTAQR